MLAFFRRGGLAATRDDQPVDRVPMKRFRESACRDRDLWRQRFDRHTPEPLRLFLSQIHTCLSTASRAAQMFSASPVHSSSQGHLKMDNGKGQTIVGQRDDQGVLRAQGLGACTYGATSRHG
jgi:hypothetical protein